MSSVDGHYLYMSPSYQWSGPLKHAPIKSLPRLEKHQIIESSNDNEKTTQSVPMEPTLHQNEDEDDEIKEIVLPKYEKGPSLETRECLLNAAKKGSAQLYQDALSIDDRNKSVLERASDLRRQLREEMYKMSRKVAPQVFGWAESTSRPATSRLWSSQKRIHSAEFVESMQEDDYWTVLKGLEAHTLNIHNPKDADVMFAEMRRALTRNDLKGIDPTILSSHYPRLIDPAPLFSEVPFEPNPSKPKRKKVLSPKASEPSDPKPQKLSIAQRRFEEELAKMEAQVKAQLNFKFKASAIPASSLEKKYDKMAHMINKSSALRKQAIIDQKNKQVCPKCSLNAVKGEPIICQCNETERIVKVVQVDRIGKEALEQAEKKRKKLIENEKLAGLTDHHTFEPSLNHAIPNYHQLQESFMEKLEKSKQSRPKTHYSPFEGLEKSQKHREEVIEKVRQKVEAEIDSHLVCFKALPVNRKILNASIVAKQTHSSKLKIERKAVMKQAEALIQETLAEDELKKRERLDVLKSQMRLHMNTELEHERKQRQAHRKSQMKEGQQARAKDFKQSMDEMKKRIAERPCLLQAANKPKHQIE